MEHSDGRNNEHGRAQWLTDTALVRDESSSVAGAVSTLQGSGRRHGWKHSLEWGKHSQDEEAH